MLSEIGVALGLCCLDFDVYSLSPAQLACTSRRFLAFETKPHTQVSRLDGAGETSARHSSCE